MTFKRWLKSTRSGSQGNCVEVAMSDDRLHVGVRDSKRGGQEFLSFSAREWTAFLASTKKHHFRDS
jgi:hypothetical protein